MFTLLHLQALIFRLLLYLIRTFYWTSRTKLSWFLGFLSNHTFQAALQVSLFLLDLLMMEYSKIKNVFKTLLFALCILSWWLCGLVTWNTICKGKRASLLWSTCGWVSEFVLAVNVPGYVIKESHICLDLDVHI